MGEEKVRLGRRSLHALIEHLEKNYTRSQIQRLLFKYALDGRFNGPNKLAALGNVFYPLATSPGHSEELACARDLLEEVAQAQWERIGKVREYGYTDEPSLQKYETLRAALRSDGLDLVEGRVTAFLSPSVDPAAEQGLLESRLDRFGLGMARRHLEQAIDCAAKGNWEAANGQVRSFVEALCEGIAAQVYDGSGTAPTRGKARKYLAESGFLAQEESDLLHALINVLNGEGPHAGTSDEDDCHRRRLMAVALANYYLDRLEDDHAAKSGSGKDED